MRRRLILLAAVPLVAVATPSNAVAARASLPAFETCSELVDYARGGLDRPDVPVRAFPGEFGAVSPRRPRSEPQPGPVGLPMPAIAAAPTAAEAGTSKSSSDAATEAFSGTNTQEANVDEPDVAKSDGKRLFLMAGTAVLAFDVTGDRPVLISKLDLGGSAGAQLLLRGDRLLVLGTPTGSSPVGIAASVAQRSQTAEPVPAPAVPGPNVTSVPVGAVPLPTTSLKEVDVRDPEAMTVAREMTVPGALVSARLTGGTIRVIFNSAATTPEAATATSPATGSAARAQTKKAKRTTFKLSNVVPRTVLRSHRTDRTFRRNLVPCDNVRHPRQFSGLDLLTVLTVDFDRGLFNVDRDAVLASAQTVYASESNLYVASMQARDLATPADVPAKMTTQIHRFDASKTGETTYTSSGSVAGFVLNQYSMSEFEGDLRVASTEQPLWFPGAATTESESAVTVLRPTGNRLTPIGRVGGLGKGERIYATRFIGDVGYLVTFRQTDPLYTLDLRDPAAPKVVGELKINGYSAYLHPIGEHLLLGVGQDATDAGRRLGAQASIFDVADPAAPIRTAQLELAGRGSSSAAEFDPHAFLWWGPTSTAILPVSGYDPTTYAAYNAAVGVTATRETGLTKVGEITHGPAWDLAAVDRSLVVGDRVFTISDLGISSNRLPGLQPLGFTAFVE